ncbi:apolipoprotein N-acyltransferase [Sphingorhabdus sp. Alg239-R122]|uniref:apolipoprotein N-acyltransferase n=1 Tax=Sphingorhabdus sp. Alg239-R122 TaxID=2305989 RepID=UPI0013DACA23|nr:apolipoprotein N-acyltransferase [Sphingorhabdus sp. Alg239-R122]
MHILTRIFDYPKWLALITGVLSATGFAPLGLWPATLVCLALLIHLIAIAPNKKAAFGRGWLFGLGHFVLGLNWIATAFTFQAAMPVWLGYIAVVLLSLYLALYPALAALAAWWIAKLIQGRNGVARANWVLVLAFAGMWIITEWLRSWVFTGFSWNPLGASLVTLPMTGFTKITGTYGLAGFVVLFSAALVFLLQRNWKSSLSMLALLAALNLAPFFWITETAPAKTPITVVQPNIGQDVKWEEDNAAQNFAKLAQLTQSDSSKPRLIFWPEAAIPDFLEKGYPNRFYYPGSPEQSRARLRATMNTGDIMVLGALKLDVNAGGQIYGARNSVMAMDTDSELISSYDKSHLVPYGEYLPMRPLLSLFGLSRLAPGDLDFTPGPGPRNIDLASFGTAGIQVCYEIIFSGQVVDPDNRPDFIFNPSNDAWFGAWGPPQHLAQAQLRAVEEGLPVIRSTPTGISAVVDANGRIRESVPIGQAGRIDTALPAAHAPTLFARYGNILPIVFAIILLISAVAIGRHRR